MTMTYDECLELIDDLRTARARISGEGQWTKHAWGYWRQPAGGVCALGALGFATGLAGSAAPNAHDQRFARTACALYRAVVGRRIADPVTAAHRIAQFNDDEASSQADVISTFDFAIDQSERLLAELRPVEIDDDLRTLHQQPSHV